MSEPFVLQVEDGAPLGLTVSYEAYPGERPILDCAREISGWIGAKSFPQGTPKEAKGNLWVADIPEDVDRFYSLFDEGNAYVRLRGAEDCRISQCTFVNGAGTGIRLDLYCRNNRIEDNIIDNLGHTGILLCGYGPGAKDVNKHNIVTNNEISRVGRLWFHAMAIFVFQSGYNTISHNYIHDTSYDAIVVSGVRPRFFGWRFNDFPNFTEAYPNLREIMSIMRWDEIGGKPATFKGCLDFAHSGGNYSGAMLKHVNAFENNMILNWGSPALQRGFRQIPFESIGLLNKPAVNRLRERGVAFSKLWAGE